MPIIQQSALKSTGGRSERKTPPARRNAYRNTRDDVHMTSPPPLGQGPENTVAKAKNRQTTDAGADWCYSCVDGGDLLSCDLCHRSICTNRCIKLSIPFRDILKSGLAFACPTCHTEHYFNRQKTYAPYFGLYTGQLTPDFDTNVAAFQDRPAIVDGPFYLKHVTSQRNLRSFLILHFTLEGINPAGSPANVVHEFLRGYFKNDGSLRFEEITFNLIDEDTAELHGGKMEDLAAELANTDWANVWLIVTTHADQERGDLFFSRTNSTLVKSFFENVVTQPMQDFLWDRKVTCFMLVCGGLVNYQESRSGLLQVSTSYNFDHVFAFTVQGLIPSLLSSLLVDMSQATILENMDASSFVDNLILSAPPVARHTSMIHLKNISNKNSLEQGLVGMKYDWAQPSVRPWGKPLRTQCPQCLSLRPWDRVKVTSDTVLTFTCKGRYTNGSNCGYIMQLEKPENATKIPKSCWIRSPWLVDE